MLITTPEILEALKTLHPVCIQLDWNHTEGQASFEGLEFYSDLFFFITSFNAFESVKILQGNNIDIEPSVDSYGLNIEDFTLEMYNSDSEEITLSKHQIKFLASKISAQIKSV